MTIIKAADILDEPHLVAPWCYLNFLRYFQRRHPSYERERLLHEALRLWEQLSLTQRRLFERERILARIKRLGKLAPKRHGRRNIVKATAAGQRRRTTVRRLIYDKRPAGSTLRKRRLNKKRA